MNQMKKAACAAAVAMMGVSLPAFGQMSMRRAAIRPTLSTQPDAPQAPAAAPATQPADPAKIAALIGQLGNDDFKLREQASKDLTAIGPAALPALKQARASKDAEVVSRADAVIESIEKPAKPQVAQDDPQQQEGPILMNHVVVVGGGQGMIAVQMNGGMFGQDSTVNENGRTVHMHKDNKGLTFSVTENGKTTDYAVADEAELKKKNPEAYKLYEKYFGVNNVNNKMLLQLQPPPPGVMNQHGGGGTGVGASGSGGGTADAAKDDAPTTREAK